MTTNMDALATKGLSLEHDVLRYEHEHDNESWEIPLRDLRLFGEYTTPSGPAADDYFLVFFDRRGRRYELPVENASDEVVDRLHEHLGSFGFGLAHATDLASRIMWPPKYAGKPLFEFHPSPARTIGDRVRRLFGSHNVELLPSPEAREALAHDVLAIDQDPYVLDLILDAMKQRHWAVDTASTTSDAIEKISKKTYDVLLVDLQTSGIDVLRRLREKAGTSHFVVMGGETNTTRARDLADDVLIKPLNKHTLSDRLERYVANDAKTE